MVAKYARNTYYLVRHGEAENNLLGILNSVGSRKQYGLTERGRQSIRDTIEFLRDERPDFIVSSPILRARQTAEIIGQDLAIPLSLDERLCESHFGAFEETDHRKFIDFMREHGTRAIGVPELGVEGYMDIRDRLRAFLESVNQSFEGKKIVIVSHADPLQELYAELLGEPVGAEQGEGRWFPTKGSCLVVGVDGIRSSHPAA